MLVYELARCEYIECVLFVGNPGKASRVLDPTGHGKRDRQMRLAGTGAIRRR
jgi:hypothetical protein